MCLLVAEWCVLGWHEKGQHERANTKGPTPRDKLVVPCEAAWQAFLVLIGMDPSLARRRADCSPSPLGL